MRILVVLTLILVPAADKDRASPIWYKFVYHLASLKDWLVTGCVADLFY